MSLDRRFVILSIPELNYLLLNLTALENQLARYRMADPDFVEQAQNAAGAGRCLYGVLREADGLEYTFAIQYV